MLAQAERELGDQLPHAGLALWGTLSGRSPSVTVAVRRSSPRYSSREIVSPGWKRVISSLKSFSRVTAGRSPS